MKVRAKGLALAGVLCGLVFGVAACGGSSSSSTTGASSGGGGGGSTLKPALDGSGETLLNGKKALSRDKR